jgi:2-octaprenyl-6-methoxyphenol hydroxylase
MHAPEPGPDCDVAIVGGGLVGASLALALAELPLRVTLVEAALPGSPGQPSFDTRTTALSNGSRRILEGLGVWTEIARSATPITRIHVSERGRFGSATLDAADEGLAALGYVVENRAIGAALWRRLDAAPRVSLVAPATVTGAATHADRVTLDLDGAAGPARVEARLAVAADGANSLVRRESGIGASRREYDQVAVITTVAPERLHGNVAYERFTPEGPIAMLPVANGRVGVVYTLAPEAGAAVLALDDAAFAAHLQQAFGWRLGRLRSPGPRHAYPLALTRAESQSAPRLAVVGNAAQGLHPIAGQGFNLGLRDAATLAEVVALAGADPGAPGVLAEYVDWRAADRRALIAFTDGLVRLFASPLAPLAAARNLGLVLFDLCPPAKSAMSRLALGFARRQPRLARALPLVPAGGPGAAGAP